MQNLVLPKSLKQVIFLILWLHVIIFAGATTEVTANVAQPRGDTQIADTLNVKSKKMTEAEELDLTFKELAYYFEASLKFYVALGVFSKIYSTNPPEIACRFCPKRSLLCDELIKHYIQVKAMRKAIGAKDSIANKARKNMLLIYDEITQLLCAGSLDDVRKFMVKIAQEKKIPCEGCKKFEWQAIGVNKSAI